MSTQSSDSLGKATESTSNGPGTETDETYSETDTASEGEVWDSCHIFYSETIKQWRKNNPKKERKEQKKKRNKEEKKSTIMKKEKV